MQVQALTCAEPNPSPSGPLCIDNWGLDRTDRVEPAPEFEDHYYYRQSAGSVKVFIIDKGVAADNREFLDPIGNTRVELGIDTGNCNVFPSDCDFGDFACESQSDPSVGHGTHVAAIIGGRTFGVAKDVSIEPVKALCAAYTAIMFTRASEYILLSHPTNAPTAIVNLSGKNNLGTVLGTGGHCSYYDPINCGSGATTRAAVIALARRDNLLLVQSAGNNSFSQIPYLPVPTTPTYYGIESACDHSFGDETRYPATVTPPETVSEREAISRIFITAGSDEFDGLWRPSSTDDGYPAGSTVGSCVDIFAPASHIVSAYYPLNPGAFPEQDVCQLSGTSMAAPHVSGVAAMILQGHPYLSSRALKALILNWGELNSLQANSSDPHFIGTGSPNRLLNWNPSLIFRDGFETMDTRAWE